MLTSPVLTDSAEAPSVGRTADFLRDDPGAGFTVARRAETVRVHLADTEDSAVRRAAVDLARDLERVTGADASTTPEADAARIVVGTIGVSPAVDAAIADGTLDVSGLYDEHGSLRWEGFTVAVAGEVLYLVGADRRGTVYAIYDLTAAIGVSPWTWWGDVPVREREHVTFDPATQVVDWPSVRYRGIFLNDEEELDAWARIHTPDGTIGPATYARVYELILRLKGNYLWPAMHVNAFNHDPENGRLAHEMGVVIGTSHCDMLLRSNEREFTPWVAAQGEPVQYDYSIDGRNRELLQEYWRGSVEQNADYEVTWTVGMRGVHDSGFVTTAIDEDDSLSEVQKQDARVRLLETVMRDQRGILEQRLGRPAHAAPQLFIPYKEVLPLYDAGLQVPEDVTIVWANDSFGHIRRFPDALEQQRPGGHGLYYHSSYWSNYTTSYLATSSTPLSLMKAELRKAWDGGIRELWVDNIGGLKPLEIEMEFFLRSAWEAGRESSSAGVTAFTAEWIDAAFSGGHGEAAAAIYADYYRLNNQRKLEHLASDTFPQLGYGDEAGRRLARLRRLYDDTNAILTALPEDERDAFFQLFAVKIHLSYLTGAEFYFADRSTIAADQGKLAAADHYVAVSRSFGDSIRAMVDFYNTRMAGGRWRGMFTPQEFPPPVMPLHPAATPALALGAAALLVTVWGDAEALEFSAGGVAHKWIEVANAGAGELAYRIEAEPWLDVAAQSGVVATEERIRVSLRDAGVGASRAGSIRITASQTGESVEVPVLVGASAELPDGFSGWVEADGYVSIDPSLAARNAPGRRSRWTRVPLLGRYGNDAIQAEPLGAHPPGIHDAFLEFELHLSTPGAHLFELHRLPTLNSTGRIRVGVSVDDHPPVVLESRTTDEHRGGWSAAIQDNIERLRVHLPWLDAGVHRLFVHAVDDYVPLSKLVIYTRRPAVTNLGPEFSRRGGVERDVRHDPDPIALADVDLGRDADAYYRTTIEATPLLGQVYAGAEFWRGPTTFQVPASEPMRLAQARRPAIGTGAVIETGGVLAFEAENALAADASAWRTPDVATQDAEWTHTQAETAGGTGLAMHVRERGLRWDDPSSAPGLHYALHITAPGRYRAWLLVTFDDNRDDSCVLAVDGIAQPVEEQFSGGELCSYGLRQRWIWAAISDVELGEGAHTFSVLARKSGLRVDRVYLTLGSELPPVDADWVPSPRRR